MRTEPRLSSGMASNHSSKLPKKVAAAISMIAVGKAFGGSIALLDATLDIKQGSIHALVGENGAGKSTLLGIMSGRVNADSGAVYIRGSVSSGGDPRLSRALGLVTVHQELMMVPALSALENVFLGQTWTRWGFLRTNAMRRRYKELCNEFEVSIPADALVERLSVSNQQVLEILRGVQSNAHIVLLDEPTATLAEHERESFYRVVRRLHSRGTTIVLVSHNLSEVLALSDTITVLRNGEVIRTAETASWSREKLIESMIGRDVAVVETTNRKSEREVLFEADGIRPRKGGPKASVTIGRGEIVGMWGLVGSGRTSFLKSLAGAMPGSVGRLRHKERKVAWPTSIRAANKLGIVMVPESRKQALVMNMSAVDNFWLGRNTNVSPFIQRRMEAQEAVKTAAFFAFNTARIGEVIGNLSGGNQQKVLLAKAAGRKPEVFLIDEPTRGIDVGAKAEVLQSLVRLADEGAGILMTSSELEEVLSICSRILVFANGAIVREIPSGHPDFNVDDIVTIGFSEGNGPE